MKSLSETLLPTPIRPFLTFRTATYLGCGIFVLSSLLRVFVTLSPSAAAFQDELFHRPAFLIGYNCLVALVMFVVFATRRYNRLYYARVYLYLLFLAGLASELAGLLFPWRVG